MPEPLEVQLARVDEQIKALRQLVEGARYIADVANKNSERLAVHEERFNDVRDEIASLRETAKDIKESCNGLGDLIRAASSEIQAVKAEQEKVKRAQADQAQVTTATVQGRYLVIAALIGGSVTIIVQLVASHAP